MRQGGHQQPGDHRGPGGAAGLHRGRVQVRAETNVHPKVHNPGEGPY